MLQYEKNFWCCRCSEILSEQIFNRRISSSQHHEADKADSGDGLLIQEKAGANHLSKTKRWKTFLKFFYEVPQKQRFFSFCVTNSTPIKYLRKEKKNVDFVGLHTNVSGMFSTILFLTVGHPLLFAFNKQPVFLISFIHDMILWRWDCPFKHFFSERSLNNDNPWKFCVF